MKCMACDKKITPPVRRKNYCRACNIVLDNEEGIEK